VSAAGCDCAVIGAGMRGLADARGRLGRDANVKLVERLPAPGGHLRTQRIAGHVCESGPFAFTADELAPLLALLQHPPRVVPGEVAARSGLLVRAAGAESVQIGAELLSFAGGNEDLVTAFRRELGSALWLGREVTGLLPQRACFELRLGGEVAATLAAREVVCATPVSAAARLLAPLDPHLDAATARLRQREFAFVFLGIPAGAAPRGYGIALEDPAASLVEAIFCTNVFPGRALPGRALLRLEVQGELLALADRDVPDAAAALLRQHADIGREVLFRHVARCREDVRDAAWMECRMRVVNIAGRVPGLTILL
jgi:protoporphyrinogen oxidase